MILTILTLILSTILITQISIFFNYPQRFPRLIFSRFLKLCASTVEKKKRESSRYILKNSKCFSLSCHVYSPHISNITYINNTPQLSLFLVLYPAKIALFLLSPQLKLSTLFFFIFFKNTYPTRHAINSVIGNAHQISETPI